MKSDEGCAGISELLSQILSSQVGSPSWVREKGIVCLAMLRKGVTEQAMMLREEKGWV